MPDLRALIVDDEPLARRELRRLLAAHPVTVVGEAADADEAEALLTDADTLPDVVFLDIQMPGRTGFDLLDDLEVAPDVVFVTAYDEHALRAFRVSALDYLLKPVDAGDLAQAVARVSARRAARPAPNERGDDGGPDASGPESGGRLGVADRVFVKDGERMHLVRLGDVRRFESAGNYTRLHFQGPDGRPARPLVLRSLSSLEDRLDPAHFARASRTEIVGLAWIVGLDDAASGGLTARLDDGTTSEFSRRRAVVLRERLRL